MPPASAGSNVVPYVALLRGINVGGKHLLPMQQLAEMFRTCKCVDVRTYIQSGNVIFRATPKVAEGLSALVAKQIAERFGFAVPVILRSAKELAHTIQNNPFLKSGMSEKTLHVYFLADKPSPAAVKGLDPQRSVQDGFQVSGREVYLYLPNGMARTKLTNAYFDSQLSTICTARNWATVLRLLEMTAV